MAQFDALQVAVALARAHALAQLPQWPTSLVVLISQPVEVTLSQSAWPALHDEIAQLEPLQAGPVIIEDNCFVGARSEVAEGVIVRTGAVAMTRGAAISSQAAAERAA